MNAENEKPKVSRLLEVAREAVLIRQYNLELQELMAVKEE